MKKFKALLLIILIIPCFFLFSGCEEKIYVTGISQTATTETSQTYTVYYSDGSTSTFTVENGKDGNDAELNLEELFSSLVARGLYTNTNDGFKKFIKDYFAIESDDSIEQQAINKGLQSAVSVYCVFDINETFRGEPLCVISTGSGVIYSMNTQTDESYIITNCHVVYSTESKYQNNIANDIVLYQYGVSDDLQVEKPYNANKYSAYNFGPDAVSCTYVGSSMEYDIAVLKVKTSDLISHNPTAVPAQIAESYTVGNTAIAIGNPEGEGISATKGIVSVDSEYLTMSSIDETTETTFRVMRIDTSVNGGNSGGGLFNANGELIGIVNAKALSSSNGNNLENMAYALPIDNVKHVVQNIIDNSKVKTLRLSVTFEIVNSSSTYNPTTGEISLYDEIKIKQVDEGFGKDLGIKVGNTITKMKINNTEYSITRHFQVKDLLLTVRPNDTVSITIRNNQGLRTYTKVAESKYFITIN